MLLSDPWLNRWLPLILEGTTGAPVLEIGCGLGDDTATLTAAGLAVTAFDLSSSSVAATKLRVPRANVECRDIRDPFPITDATAGVVVASLTLHYFPWIETVALVDRVRRTLKPNGLFLCRLNSTEDANFGATGHPSIEPNYYLVDGQPKRFFDEAGVDEIFSGNWEVLSKEHMATRKYVKEKTLWEVVARRGDA